MESKVQGNIERESAGKKREKKFHPCGSGGQICILGALMVVITLALVMQICLSFKILILEGQMVSLKQSLQGFHGYERRNSSVGSTDEKGYISRSRRNHGQQRRFAHLIGDGVDINQKSFLWRKELSTPGFTTDPAGEDERIKSLVVEQGGLYFIYSQVHVHGRKYRPGRRNSHVSDPSVGIKTVRERTRMGSTDLARSFITQDQRGQPYRRTKPMDAINQMGLYWLQSHDKISVEVIGAASLNYEFDNSQAKGYFGIIFLY